MDDDAWLSPLKKDGNSIEDRFANPGRSLAIQLAISLVFGLSAFLAFCLWRPRWTSLYSARRKRRSEASPLPQLPDSFFGWIPVVWRITEEEVLASAGLDAYAFLRFFKLAMKFTAVTLFFGLSVIFPVIRVYDPESDPSRGEGDGDGGEDDGGRSELRRRGFNLLLTRAADAGSEEPYIANDYLWIYWIFVYFFSAVGIWLIIKETQKMISVRQKYLALRSSVSDRTIRLSGIPEDLRSEEKIKETVENLEIGKVESVTLCRDWHELDELMAQRKPLLESVEQAWAQHLGGEATKKSMKRRYGGSDYPGRGTGSNGSGQGDEEARLLDNVQDSDDRTHVLSYDKPRPQKRLWYGFLKLQTRKVDAIDYYEEKLRRLDEKIKAARKKEYRPMPLAFVTLDSIAACQMACQAILDPQPMQLTANPSPSPSGVVWQSTYLSRKTRMIRSWSITTFIFWLTILWSFLLLPLAGITSTGNIESVAPGLGKFLADHPNVEALVTSGVPTLLLAVLNVVVPYFYEYLSYKQGMTSLADIEMSLISKNFFFTFFNLFVVLTTLGTASTAVDLWKGFDSHLRDLPKIAYTLRQGLIHMSGFYMNYIALQTFGLFPFRLLQFGSVALHPYYSLQAQTPRDYSQLTQPGTFTYGFFIPQTLFMLLICTVYSVMRHTETIQAIGFCYFALGSFIYKYQLLYSMDQNQFGTGRAWPMMCVRFAIGLVVLQLIMAGQLAFKGAFIRAALVAPLIVATIWFISWYRRTYEPLTKNIALRTLRDAHEEAEERRMAASIMSSDVMSPPPEEEDGSGNNNNSTSNSQRLRWPDPFPSPNSNSLAPTLGGIDATLNGSAPWQSVLEEQQRQRPRYVNPNLVKPLREPWIARNAEREAERNRERAPAETRDEPDADVEAAQVEIGT